MCADDHQNYKAVSSIHSVELISDCFKDKDIITSDPTHTHTHNIPPMFKNQLINFLSYLPYYTIKITILNIVAKQ